MYIPSSPLLDTQLYETTNQKPMKVPKVVKPTNMKSYYKILGTSVINSQMSPPLLPFVLTVALVKRVFKAFLITIFFYCITGKLFLWNLLRKFPYILTCFKVKKNVIFLKKKYLKKLN